MGRKCSKKYQGGILLSLILLFSVMGLIFIQLVTDYQLRGRSQRQTEDFYLALTFEAWTIADLRRRLALLDTNLPLVGSYNYNRGEVRYQILPKKIRLETEVDSMTAIIESNHQRTILPEGEKEEISDLEVSGNPER